ncbi:MAG TPA: TrbG/VirB9 family P-type conjugative transfer protein [Terriglobales bacterium]|nr:TrbG/VirB9 family P-type conjugative transfer protein [Terriglobales bacterium]
MKQILSILLCVFSIAFLQAQDAQPATQKVLRVATALNHLTVLEFHEPVTMAAAGSSDFQIERQGDKVFVKPTKPDVSTDLLVWTQSKRFAYELETTAEVTNMNFTIDAAVPVREPTTTSADELADTILTRALLGTAEIKNRQRQMQNRPAIQIEEVFRTRSTIYIRYCIQNNTETIYRPGLPTLFELRPENSPTTLGSLVHTQLDKRDIKKFGTAEVMPLVTARAESDSQDIEPGAFLHGVIALRQDFITPTVLQLEFKGNLTATFVL